jgi:hypothetical protein
MKHLKLNIVMLTVISALMGTASAGNLYRTSLGLSEESLEINVENSPVKEDYYDGTWASFFHDHQQLTHLSALSEWESKGGEASLESKGIVDTDMPFLPINSDYIYDLILSFNDITHVDFLSNIVTVEKGLLLQDNPSLTNVDGLSSLYSAYSLYLYNNPSLKNLDGLSSLVSAYNLFLHNNTSVTNIDGLSSLEEVGSLLLMNNSSLTNVNGLSSLTVAYSVMVSSNQALTNLDGLSSLVSVHASYLNNNPSLTNVNGLSSLSKATGLVQLQDNPLLTDISGLSNLMEAHPLIIDTPSQYTTKPTSESNFCKGILSGDIDVRKIEINGPDVTYSELCN